MTSPRRRDDDATEQAAREARARDIHDQIERLKRGDDASSADDEDASPPRSPRDEIEHRTRRRKPKR